MNKISMVPFSVQKNYSLQDECGMTTLVHDVSLCVLWETRKCISDRAMDPMFMSLGVLAGGIPRNVREMPLLQRRPHAWILLERQYPVARTHSIYEPAHGQPLWFCVSGYIPALSRLRL